MPFFMIEEHGSINRERGKWTPITRRSSITLLKKLAIAIDPAFKAVLGDGKVPLMEVLGFIVVSGAAHFHPLVIWSAFISSP